MNTRARPPVSVISAGVQFAVCVLVSLWLGYQADRRFDATPWGTLAGMIIGMVAGTWSVLRPLWREAEQNGEEGNRQDAKRRR